MNIQLIYHTPAYHKLVETVARVCYQSFEKESRTSHLFIRAIMAKGHLSVASVGNLVFSVDYDSAYEESYKGELVHDFLLDAHEETQFIRWSRRSGTRPSKHAVVISMNMLTFLDIRRTVQDGTFPAVSSGIFEMLEAEVSKVPYLRWFYDKTTNVEESENPYSALGMPELYQPLLLTESYTALKALGFTQRELEIHAEITMNFITDRSTSLQFWRHWAGGCELSQRYVLRDNAGFREMVGLAEYLAAQTHVSAQKLALLLDKKKEDALWTYEYIMDLCKDVGIRTGRAKEIARSILPNNIVTQCMQSRPYRNWLHLFELRDSSHAQKEAQADVVAMKKVLETVGVPTSK